jgi:hypothetical protein
MASRKSKTASEAEPKWERTPREVEAVRKVVTGRMEGVPRLKIAKSESGGSSYITEHIDDLAGKALIMEEIATTDVDFFAGFVAQLAKAGGGEPDEQQLNFMLSVVKGIKPRDQVEAMLAAQMAATHSATMKFSYNLAEAECVEHRDSAERGFNKFTRTFVSQMEALKKYRAGVEQTVTVQQVNVSEGGQAIVGNVTQGQKDAAPNRVPPQPLALAHDDTLPMEIIESKEAVPVAAPRDANKK